MSCMVKQHLSISFSKTVLATLQQSVRRKHADMADPDWIECMHKPVGLRTQRGQSGVSCQAAGCEAYTPSRTAGSLTSRESQKSQAGCNLQGNLKDT